MPKSSSSTTAKPRCASCRRPQARSHAFCPYCGTPLRVQPEIKHVSVLFADLCDSTRLISGRTPEAAQQFLQSAIEIMTTAIDSFGGTLNQDRGDGIVVVFGAPRAQEDHALRAALAALKMQRDARAQSLALRVGIHSGPTLVKVVAASVDAFHGIDGSTVHLAARLEQLAQPGTVLVSHGTFRLLHDQVEARSLGLHAIRGFDERQTLYELIDTQGTSAAAPMARRRHLAPLVGRDDALARLHAAAGQTQNGLRVVGLRGEAGVGKTRLLSEFLDSLDTAQMQSTTVRCRSYLADSPWSTLAAMAQELMALHRDADDADATGGPLAAVDLALSALLGRPHAELETWQALGPRARRQRTAQALEWLLRSLCSRRPLLVAIEDYHVADQESQRLLDVVLRRCSDAPLLVCLSCRPEFAHRWHDAAWFSEIELHALSAAHMQHMARLLLGDDPSLDRVHAAMVERADGKPFFLEQMAIALVDDGTLIGPPGGYRVAAAHAPLPAPGSIAVMTAALIDRLPASAKPCVRAAAVLGGPIRLRHVAQVTGQPEIATAEQLRVCVDAGLLRATPDGHEFRHALVQETVMASLTHATGVALHRAVHAVLVQDHGHEPPMAALVARHAASGELWVEAGKHRLQAIAFSAAQGAHRDALRHFQLGCDAVSKVTEARARDELEMKLRLAAIAAQMPLGQLDDILSNLARAADLARGLGDTRRIGSVTLQRAVLYWMRGDYRQAIGEARAARDIGIATSRGMLQLSAQEVGVMSLHGLGRYTEAVDLARAVMHEHAAELADMRPPSGWPVLPAINLQVFLFSSLWRLDRMGEAEAACRTAYALLEQHDHPYSRGLIDHVRAEMLLERGRSREALELMGRCVQACERHDLLTLQAGAQALLAGAMTACGRGSEAVEVIERALGDGSTDSAGSYNVWLLHHHLAHALLEAGREDEALERVRFAVRYATQGQQFGHLVVSLVLEGRIRAARGDIHGATAALGRAGRRARDCGMAYLEREAQDAARRVSAGAVLARTGGLPHE